MSRYTVCIACIVGLIIVLAIPGVPFLILYYAVQPRNPTFILNDASITGFNLTSDGHLTCYFQVVLQATNPNRKIKLKYWDVRVWIYKQKQPLAVDAFDDFTQRKGDVRLLSAAPVALNVTLNTGPAFDFGVESGMGYLDFDVYMTAKLNTDSDTLMVNCPHALGNFTAPSIAVQNFQKVDCSVFVYSKDDDE